jgi:hypothetical protein
MEARAVNQLAMDGTFINEFPRIIDAARETETSAGDIVWCCRGKRKSANGFRWEYCNKYIHPLPIIENMFFLDNDYEDDFFLMTPNTNISF